MASSASGGGSRPYNQRALRVPSLARKARALAKSHVILRRDGAAFVLTLPTNDGYKRPNEIDRERGIQYAEYDSAAAAFIPIEPNPLEVAEMAITYAAHTAAQPSNLAQWATQAAKARGGNKALAAALVALEPDPKHPQTDTRNMLRKVEEWRQGKYTRAAGRNKRRVADYVLDHARRLSIGVTGHWYMFKEENAPPDGPIFRRFNTRADDEQDTAMAKRVLLTEGEDYVGIVEHAANRQVKAYATQVETVNALHCEVEP